MSLKDKLNQLFSEADIDVVLNEGVSVIGAIDAVRMALPEVKTKVSQEKISTIFDKMISSIEDYFQLKQKSLQLQQELLDIELKKYAGTRFEALPAVQKIKEKADLTKKSITEHENDYKKFQDIKNKAYNIISDQGKVSLVHADKVEPKEVEKADTAQQKTDQVQQAVIGDIQKAAEKPQEQPPELDVPELNPDEITKQPEPTKSDAAPKPPPKETILQKLRKAEKEPLPVDDTGFQITPKQIDVTPFLNQQAKEIWNKLSEDEKIQKYELMKTVIRSYRKQIASEIMKLSTSQMDESVVDDIFQLVPNLKASIKNLSPENVKKLEDYIQTTLMPQIIEKVSAILIQPDTKIINKPINQRVQDVFHPPEETAALEPKPQEPDPTPPPTPEIHKEPVEPVDTEKEPIDIPPETTPEPPKDSPENTIVEPPKPEIPPEPPKQQPISDDVELSGKGKAKLQLIKMPSGKYQIKATNPLGTKTITVPGEYTKEDIALSFGKYKQQLGIPDSELPKYNAWANPDAEEQARKHAEIKAKMDAEKEQLKNEPAPNPDAEEQPSEAKPVVKAGKGRKKKKVD